MSRCIPFPPPGYVWNGVGGDALVELIELFCSALKLNRERVKAEKKRKNEERRRKKEKKKSGHEDDKKRSREKIENLKKRKYEEATGLENSSLSEELGLPMNYDSMYDSSANSQNVERRNDKLSLINFHNHGDINDFYSQPQNRKYQAAQSSKEVCPVPKRPHKLVHGELETAPRPNNEPTSRMPTTISLDLTCGLSRESCQSYAQTEVVTGEKAKGTGFIQIESEYRELIVNWIPLPLQTEHPEFDDQEWVFQRKQNRSEKIRKANACNEDFCHGSNVGYPVAQYLSKADIWALPFAISF